MKLYHYDFGKDTLNFGDDLNGWLWPRLLPGLLDDDPSATLVGIGTLLNERLREETPHAQRRLIFSTGAGYGDGSYRPGPCDRVYCVRGPLTAQALGLPPASAIADGAVLVRRFVQTPARKHCAFAYMPHIEQIADRAWQSVCAELGIGYLDPRWPTERLLEGIGRTEVLLTETMHGAIVADALRVPWVAVTTHAHILPFKWQDWCASVGVTYQPHPIEPLWNTRPTRDLLTPIRRARDCARRGTALRQMAEIVRTARPCLSRDEDLERVTVRLEECVARLARDIRAGDFEASPAPRFALRESRRSLSYR